MDHKIIPHCESITVSPDDRGVFVEFLSDTDKAERPAIKRIYYVYNWGRGVIRGFHFHKKEWKYYIAVSGAAKFAVINPKKPEERYFFTSSVRKPNLIVVPPGYANGWMSLEDQTVLVGCSTLTIAESIRDDRRFDPYKWGDIWTVKGR